MKTEVVGCKTDKGYTMFFDVDHAYSKKDKGFLKRFATRHSIPLHIIKSSNQGFHVISFTLFSNINKVDRIQELLRIHYGGNYPSLSTCLFEYEHWYGNVLRIGYKNKNRPDKLLDQFPIKSLAPASESHIRLYQVLVYDPKKNQKTIKINQPIKETMIDFLETDLDNVWVVG